VAWGLPLGGVAHELNQSLCSKQRVGSESANIEHSNKNIPEERKNKMKQFSYCLEAKDVLGY
jgi:hypothetical protein